MCVPASRCMSTVAPKPTVKPECAQFSSGPCKKRPGYTVAGLAGAVLGRSHRHKVGKDKLAGAINGTRELLEPVGLPKDYHIGIVPASDTGAVEMAMWSLLGPKPVTCVHFESFGGDWHTDITKQLKLKDVTNMQVGTAASPHQLPPLPTLAPSSHHPRTTFVPPSAPHCRHASPTAFALLPRHAIPSSRLSALGSRPHRPSTLTRARATTACCPTSPRSTSTRTSSSLLTAPPRACASPLTSKSRTPPRPAPLPPPAAARRTSLTLGRDVINKRV